MQFSRVHLKETENLPKNGVLSLSLLKGTKPRNAVRFHHRNAPPRNNNCKATTMIKPKTFFSSCSSKINLHPSFPTKRNSWLGCCRATSPQLEPPPKKHPPPYSGVRGEKALFSRFQHTLQIFFAVLFWMSLFFWSCAWDWENHGRPNQRSQFRK